MKLFSLSILFIILASVSAFSRAVTFGLGADLTFPLAELRTKLHRYGAAALLKFGVLPIVDLTGSGIPLLHGQGGHFEQFDRGCHWDGIRDYRWRTVKPSSGSVRRPRDGCLHVHENTSGR